MIMGPSLTCSPLTVFQHACSSPSGGRSPTNFDPEGHMRFTGLGVSSLLLHPEVTATSAMTTAPRTIVAELIFIQLRIYLTPMQKGTRFERVPLVSRRLTSGRGAGRAEQVAAQRRISDPHIADDVDQRGLAGFERALQRGRDLFIGLDMLRVASHFGENLVVADVRQHVEWIGFALESRHLIEV